MSKSFTKDIMESFTTETLNQTLNDLGIKPKSNWLSRCKQLSDVLINRGYKGDATMADVRKFLKPEQTPDEPSKMDMIAEREHRLEELRMEQEMLEEEIDALIYGTEALPGPVQVPHNERQDAYDRQQEMDAIMDIPAFDTPISKSHEERERKWKESLQEVSNDLLTGDINYRFNKEITEFIKNHKPKFIDDADDEYIPLFPVDADTHEDFLAKLQQVRNGYGNKPNNEHIDSHDDYTLYYLNNLTSVRNIFKFLDSVYDKHKDSPFKLMCDAGFMQQSHDGSNISYHYKPPSEMNEQRAVPVVISSPSDVETYKHYIYSYISEKMEETHENSRNRFCAIVAFMFKVIPLTRTGKRISHLGVASGYEFLLHRENIVTIECDYNICLFTSNVAGHKLI